MCVSGEDTIPVRSIIVVTCEKYPVSSLELTNGHFTLFGRFFDTTYSFHRLQCSEMIDEQLFVPFFLQNVIVFIEIVREINHGFEFVLILDFDSCEYDVITF